MGELAERLRRFSLLRNKLDEGQEPKELLASPHASTRLLTRFVWNHTRGAGLSGGERVDFISLWLHLDLDGREELIAYLREVVS